MRKYYDFSKGKRGAVLHPDDIKKSAFDITWGSDDKASPVQDAVRPRGLDSVILTDSALVRDGLDKMLTAAIGEHGYSLMHVDVQLAVLVIEVARRAEDREDWFPLGKWPTVQAMRVRTEHELRRLFRAV